MSRLYLFLVVSPLRRALIVCQGWRHHWLLKYPFFLVWLAAHAASLMLPDPEIAWPIRRIQRLLMLVRDRTMWNRKSLAPHLLLYAQAGLKHRGRKFMLRQNFPFRVGTADLQLAQRDFIVWQDKIAKMPEMKGIPADVAVCLDGAAHHLQIDGLFSLVCLSDVVSNFSVFWDNATFDAHLRHVITSHEARRLEENFLVSALTPVATDQREAVEKNGAPVAFAARYDPRRAAISFLKVAVPNKRIVTISLPETESGDVGPALNAWAPLLAAIKSSFLNVEFCLLNRDPFPIQDTLSWLVRVRSVGFGFADAIALAQVAHLHIGVLDAVGLAALAGGRPGVYWSLGGPIDADLVQDPERPVWRACGPPNPAKADAIVRGLLSQVGARQTKIENSIGQ